MEFYTYTYAYPENYPVAHVASTVFYVGKGQGDRIDAHEREARKGFTSRKCAIIREIWAQGFQVVKTKVFTTEIEQDTYIYEWILINLVYGRESLTNYWEGGKSALEHKKCYKPVAIMLSQETLDAIDAVTPDSRSDYIRRVLQVGLTNDLEAIIQHPSMPRMLEIKPRRTVGLQLPLDLISHLQDIRYGTRSAVIEFLVRVEIGLTMPVHSC